MAPCDTPPQLDPAMRAALEELYRKQLASIIALARVLGKPLPVQTRDERRQARQVTD